MWRLPALVVLVVLALVAPPAGAATTVRYLGTHWDDCTCEGGANNGSRCRDVGTCAAPGVCSCNDAPGCGTPRSNACATPVYLRKNRSTIVTGCTSVANNCVVRLDEETFVPTNPASADDWDHFCLAMDNYVHYEARTNADAAPAATDFPTDCAKRGDCTWRTVLDGNAIAIIPQTCNGTTCVSGRPGPCTKNADCGPSSAQCARRLAIGSGIETGMDGIKLDRSVGIGIGVQNGARYFDMSRVGVTRSATVGVSIGTDCNTNFGCDCQPIDCLCDTETSQVCGNPGNPACPDGTACHGLAGNKHCVGKCDAPGPNAACPIAGDNCTCAEDGTGVHYPGVPVKGPGQRPIDEVLIVDSYVGQNARVSRQGGVEIGGATGVTIRDSGIIGNCTFCTTPGGCGGDCDGLNSTGWKYGYVQHSWIRNNQDEENCDPGGHWESSGEITFDGCWISAEAGGSSGNKGTGTHIHYVRSVITDDQLSLGEGTKGYTQLHYSTVVTLNDGRYDHLVGAGGPCDNCGITGSVLVSTAKPVVRFHIRATRDWFWWFNNAIARLSGGNVVEEVPWPSLDMCNGPRDQTTCAWQRPYWAQCNEVSPAAQAHTSLTGNDCGATQTPSPLCAGAGAGSWCAVSGSPDQIPRARAQGDAGEWSAAEFADCDTSWSTPPAFVSLTNPLSPDKLRLQATDTIAKDRGVPISCNLPNACCEPGEGCGIDYAPKGSDASGPYTGRCRQPEPLTPGCLSMAGKECNENSDCVPSLVDYFGAACVGPCDLGAIEVAATTTTVPATPTTSNTDPTTSSTTSTSTSSTTSTSLVGTCANVITLPPDGGTVTGTITASGSLQAGTCGQTTVSGEQIYEWTPTLSGLAIVQTCGAATAYDTVLYVRTPPCAGGTQVSCNDDCNATCLPPLGCQIVNGTSKGSRVAWTVTAGQTYFLFVDGFNGQAGAFELTVTPPSSGPPPTIVTTTTTTSTSSSTSSSLYDGGAIIVGPPPTTP